MLKVALEVVHILVRDENMDTEKINPHMAKKELRLGCKKAFNLMLSSGDHIVGNSNGFN